MLKKKNIISKRLVAFLILDLAVLYVAPVLARQAFHLLGGAYHPRHDIYQVDQFFALKSIVLYCLPLYLLDQYNFKLDFRTLQNLTRILAAVLVGGVAAIAIAYLQGIRETSRLLSVLDNLALFSGFAISRVASSLIASASLYGKRTLIVGCGESGRAVAEELRRSGNKDLKPLGFLDVDPAKAGTTVQGLPVFLQDGPIRDAVCKLKPHLLIIAMRRRNYEKNLKDVIWCAQQGIEVWDVPAAFERLSHRIPLAFVDEQWLLYVAVNNHQPYYRKFKRLMDVVLSLAGLVVSAPIMAVIYALVWLEGGSPVILNQKRLGQNGRVFDLYKFRSMTQCAPSPGEKGVRAGDKRVTRLGRTLRKLHLDELPQLVNILRGDASLVGPRAELYEFVCDYFGGDASLYCPELSSRTSAAGFSDAEPQAGSGISTESGETGGESAGKQDCAKNGRNLIPYFEQRFTVQQGLTGWAQIMNPYATSSHEDMVRKIEYDLYYIKNFSFSLDMLILLQTLRLVLFGKGK